MMYQKKRQTVKEEQAITLFLSLIHFRYVSNHIHPSQIILDEQSSIQKRLLSSVNRAKSIPKASQQAVFENLEIISKNIAIPILENLSKCSQEIQDFKIKIPNDLSELLFSFDLLVKTQGYPFFNARFHGSGIQTLLALIVLEFLDSRFDLGFGWHQGTIWAIEEPESFLHRDLAIKVATFLKNVGIKNNNRFQIFCTTHNDIFLRQSDKGILCKSENGRTEVEIRNTKDLVYNASILGISPYVHPLLLNEFDPLLLVEGKTDKALIDAYYVVNNRINPFKVIDIESLSKNSLDNYLPGIDGIIKYLQNNVDALRIRSQDCPVFVLVDWNENQTKINKLKSPLEQHDTSKVFQWREEDANPQLDRKFSGIERFLSTQVLEAAAASDIISLQRPQHDTYPLSPDTKSFDKNGLAEFVRDRKELKDFIYFKSKINLLEKALIESRR